MDTISTYKKGENNKHQTEEADDKHYCNTCLKVLRFRRKKRKEKGAHAQIRDHWKKHDHQKDTDQCRICLLKLPNRTVLKAHYHSQHAINMVHKRTLPEKIKCGDCGALRQASWDGRDGKYKILCASCNSKVIAKNDVEKALLAANILTKEEFKSKYPFKHELQTNDNSEKDIHSTL
eukprot:UN05871